MKSEILIVTYAKDYDFTALTLKSLVKFAQGFSGITLVVPYQDGERFKPLARRHDATLRTFYESAGKGFLHHQVCKCEADLWCPKGTDLIFHFDADCITKEPFSPSDFQRNGKPILVRERFEDFQHYAARYSWRKCVEHALGVEMEWETMVRHPNVFWADMYAPMRHHIEQRHGYPFTQYVLLQRNEFPQSFAEFPTIGGYALAFQPERYAVTTRIRTPSEYWRSFGIVPSKRDSKGKPLNDMDVHWWEGESALGEPPLYPVQYFWSRNGVTPQIRGEVQRLLGE